MKGQAHQIGTDLRLVETIPFESLQAS